MKNGVWLFICLSIIAVSFSSCSKRHFTSKSPIELQAEKDAQKERQAEEYEKKKQAKVDKLYNKQSNRTKAMMKENQRRADINNNRYKKECFLKRWFSFGSKHN